MIMCRPPTDTPEKAGGGVVTTIIFVNFSEGYKPTATS